MGFCCSGKLRHTNTVAVHHGPKLLHICLEGHELTGRERLCSCHPPQADALPSRYQFSVMDSRLDFGQAMAYQRLVGYWKCCPVQMEYHHTRLVDIVVTI